MIMLLSLVLAVHSGSAQQANKAKLAGMHVEDFQLLGVDGELHSLGSDTSARGFIIVFSCNHCPFAKLYTERLNALHKRFASQQVPLLVINPMDTVMYEEEGLLNMQKRAVAEHFDFPYLIDPLQDVARRFKARHTPQAYVVWRQQSKWVIRYAGAIDDNGEHPELATSFVAKAVVALLANQEPPTTESLSLGCRINYRQK